eukprot:353919-Chlamydomonas_euryale.AAC.15
MSTAAPMDGGAARAGGGGAWCGIGRVGRAPASFVALGTSPTHKQGLFAAQHLPRSCRCHPVQRRRCRHHCPRLRRHHHSYRPPLRRHCPTRRCCCSRRRRRCCCTVAAAAPAAAQAREKRARRRAL